MGQGATARRGRSITQEQYNRALQQYSEIAKRGARTLGQRILRDKLQVIINSYRLARGAGQLRISGKQVTGFEKGTIGRTEPGGPIVRLDPRDESRLIATSKGVQETINLGTAPGSIAFFQQDGYTYRAKRLNDGSYEYERVGSPREVREQRAVRQSAIARINQKRARGEDITNKDIVESISGGRTLRGSQLRYVRQFDKDVAVSQTKQFLKQSLVPTDSAKAQDILNTIKKRGIVGNTIIQIRNYVSSYRNKLLAKKLSRPGVPEQLKQDVRTSLSAIRAIDKLNPNNLYKKSLRIKDIPPDVSLSEIKGAVSQVNEGVRNIGALVKAVARFSLRYSPLAIQARFIKNVKNKGIKKVRLEALKKFDKAVKTGESIVKFVKNNPKEAGVIALLAGTRVIGSEVERASKKPYTVLTEWLLLEFGPRTLRLGGRFVKSLAKDVSFALPSVTFTQKVASSKAVQSSFYKFAKNRGIPKQVAENVLKAYVRNTPVARSISKKATGLRLKSEKSFVRARSGVSKKSRPLTRAERRKGVTIASRLEQQKREAIASLPFTVTREYKPIVSEEFKRVRTKSGKKGVVKRTVVDTQTTINIQQKPVVITRKGKVRIMSDIEKSAFEKQQIKLARQKFADKFAFKKAGPSKALYVVQRPDGQFLWLSYKKVGSKIKYDVKTVSEKVTKKQFGLKTRRQSVSQLSGQQSLLQKQLPRKQFNIQQSIQSGNKRLLRFEKRKQMLKRKYLASKRRPSETKRLVFDLKQEVSYLFKEMDKQISSVVKATKKKVTSKVKDVSVAELKYYPADKVNLIEVIEVPITKDMLTAGVSLRVKGLKGQLLSRVEAKKAILRMQRLNAGKIIETKYKYRLATKTLTKNKLSFLERLAMKIKAKLKFISLGGMILSRRQALALNNKSGLTMILESKALIKYKYKLVSKQQLFPIKLKKVKKPTKRKFLRSRRLRSTKVVSTSKPRRKIRIKRPRIKRPRTNKPKPKKIPRIRLKPPEGDKIPGTAFDAYIKVGKRYLRANKGALSLTDAKRLGRYVSDQTTSRSFILRRSTFKKRQKLGRNITARAIKFRPAKTRSKLALVSSVEKRKYAIDTRGEKKGLSASRFIARLKGTKRRKTIKRRKRK